MSLAFFDVDGTLLPLPPVERRFFWSLARRAQLPAMNYLRWLLEAARLGPGNLRAITQSNKAYLSGMALSVFSGAAGSIPEFFPAALQRVWCHALRGDQIVLVTGTLAELACAVKHAMERELLWRGVKAQVGVLATHVETAEGLCTGRVTGEPMFGREKASAIAQFAAARNIALSNCAAYGDHGMDRFMLATVGSPFAVNPDARLRRTAELYGWRVLAWNPRWSGNFFPRNAFPWKGETAR